MMLLKVVLVICLALCALLAGWFQCVVEPPGKRRRLNALGWSIAIFIVALTSGGVVTEWADAREAERWADQLQKTIDAQSAQIVDLKASNTKQLTDMQAASATQFAGLKVANAEQLADVKETSSKQLSELQKTIATYEGTIAELRKQVDSNYTREAELRLWKSQADAAMQLIHLRARLHVATASHAVQMLFASESLPRPLKIDSSVKFFDAVDGAMAALQTSIDDYEIILDKLGCKELLPNLIVPAMRTMLQSFDVAAMRNYAPIDPKLAGDSALMIETMHGALDSMMRLILELEYIVRINETLPAQKRLPLGDITDKLFEDWPAVTPVDSKP